MPGTVSPQIPVVNTPNATEEPKIPSAIITLRDALNIVLTSANVLNGGAIGTGTIPTAALADSSVTNPKLATNAVTNAKIQDSAVDTAEIADLAVTGGKIAGGTIGSGKLALTTDTANLATSIQPLGSSLTDLCSVTVTNGTYLVNAQAFVRAATVGQTCNAHVSVTYNGSEHESDDLVFTDTIWPGYHDVVTVTSGTTLKFRARNAGANVIQVKGGDGATSLTRLSVVRIG